MVVRILVAIQLLFHAFLVTDACTEIRLTAEDNSVIIGRTMEYGYELYSKLVVEPKGKTHSASVAEGCPPNQTPMSWTNKYEIAYLDAWNTFLPADGMNTAGLSVGPLLFPNFAQYEDVPSEQCGQALSQSDFPPWLLGNFATVQQIRESMSSKSFPLVFGIEFNGQVYELHFSVTDKTGDGIIFEFTAEGRQIYNNTFGVLTNSPPYNYQLMNIRNYIELSKYNREPLVLGPDSFPATGQGSGLLGLPGDLTPPSRFVRVAALKEFATPPANNTEAVNLAFHILNSVDIPLGVVTNRTNGHSEYTLWVVAKDLTNNAFYYRTYSDMTIRVAYLNSVQQGKMVSIPVDRPISAGFQDITAQLAPVPSKGSTPQDEL
ncbi:bile salt hydrolase/transferase-like isoform X2 [Montipora capricornis]|uniref:bile salt hydrolase/transferase-like isoform X1 n=1 Tax=Montipora capricornis TaxID=246305 RepID=UPI0035F1A2EF